MLRTYPLTYTNDMDETKSFGIYLIGIKVSMHFRSNFDVEGIIMGMQHH